MPPVLGAHMSIAGGLHRALERGKALRCDTVQIFTKNCNQWCARPIEPGEVERFQKVRSETRIEPVFAHAAYLINLGSPSKIVFRRSVSALREELVRAELLDFPFCVLHPGARLSSSVDCALGRISEALASVLGRDGKVMVLLETTAGQGSSVGFRFEQIREILDAVENRNRAGVCFDTSHVFAAGYDLRTIEAYRRTMQEFDRVVGLERIRVIHLNDSRKPLGSRIDRHEHIGKGFLGLEAFRLLVNDPQFENTPMILETPKFSPKGRPMDAVNLRVLRSLCKNNP